MSLARITIHSSQFPENVGRDLLHSLRSRQLNHKFHYDSVKQTRKWLALHETYSPARTDPDCVGTYDRAFTAAAERIHAPSVHLIGLGCGGGQKDTRLLELLAQPGRKLFYTPLDVSTAMVLVARNAALSIVPEAHCFPFVCDLATAGDLPETLASSTPPLPPGTVRLITFFGMLPNFEPGIAFPLLARLPSSSDCLLISANLAPGPDAAASMRHILPLYDNELTRDWLMTFLLDLGISEDDGELRFLIETGPPPVCLPRVPRGALGGWSASHHAFSRRCASGQGRGPLRNS